MKRPIHSSQKYHRYCFVIVGGHSHDHYDCDFENLELFNLCVDSFLFFIQMKYYVSIFLYSKSIRFILKIILSIPFDRNSFRFACCISTYRNMASHSLLDNTCRTMGFRHHWLQVFHLHSCTTHLRNWPTIRANCRYRIQLHKHCRKAIRCHSGIRCGSDCRNRSGPPQQYPPPVSSRVPHWNKLQKKANVSCFYKKVCE